MTRGGDEASPSRASVPELPAVGMDAVGAAVLVCAADGTIVDLNRAAALLLGVDPAAARGTSLSEVRQWAGTWVTESGDEIAPAASTVARLAFSGERVEGEVVGLLDSGRETSVWLRISAEPLFSPAGELEDVVLTLVDITRLKETRDALRETLAELNDLVETLPDTYVYLDADDTVRRIAGARDAVPGVPGVLTGEGVGAPVWESLSEDASARIRKAVALARATGKPVTAEIATVTPTAIRYDEVRLVPREGGTLLLIARDITESRRAAEALRQSEEKYRTLYLRTPVMLHSIDAEGRLLSVSDRWLQRLGYTADEVLGRPSVEFLTEESQAVRARGGPPGVLRHRRLRGHPLPDGRQGRLAGRRAPVRDLRAGQLRAASSARSSVLVDVTEQRRAVRELAERDRTMQTLLATIPGMAYRCANDDDWTTLLLSQGCRDLTGYDADELVGPGEATYGGLLDPSIGESSGSRSRPPWPRREPWTVTYPHHHPRRRAQVGVGARRRRLRRRRSGGAARRLRQRHHRAAPHRGRAARARADDQRPGREPAGRGLPQRPLRTVAHVVPERGLPGAARPRSRGVHGGRPDLGGHRASGRPREDRRRAAPRRRRRVRRHRVRVPHGSPPTARRGGCSTEPCSCPETTAGRPR